MSITEPSIKYFKPFDLVFVPVFESEFDLYYVFYILYPILVKQYSVKALIDLSSEINVMNPDFTKKLGF